jgi:hypothetical protein
MQQFIITDLIKYIISDYISVPVLTIINDEYVNKKRISTLHASIKYDITDITYTDNIMIRKILSDKSDNIVETNYKNNKKHGYRKIISNNVLIQKILFKNGKVISEWNINSDKQSKETKYSLDERQNLEDRINDCIIC